MRSLSKRTFLVIASSLALCAAQRTDAQGTLVLVPQSAMRVSYVDSQETAAGNFAASNSVDGSASTFWNSQFTPYQVPVPHDVRIDLGGTYPVSGFRHLPRQDGYTHGRIAGYEFYVSADGISWGTPVVAGTLANISTQQQITFTTKSGRYVRLRALSEVAGRPFTSLAELNVLHSGSGGAPDPLSGTDYGGYRPHYQGYGVNTRGGRGGVVHRVTHLVDTLDSSSSSWAGSLRKAVTASGPRFVVFEVSGTINLVSHLEIKTPFITIAGQTAPSPGILLRGGHLQVDTHDVVVQHLRIRPGNVPDRTPQGIWIRSNANNVVIDHASISWAVHNGFVASAPPAPAPGIGDVTIIDSIVSETLACSGVHQMYPCNPGQPIAGQFPHSRAMVVGDDNWTPTYNSGVIRIAFVRTISANNNDRHPAIQGGVHSVLVNNLIYNPSQTPWSGMHFSDGYQRGPLLAVVKNNLLIAGPTTPGHNGYVAPKYPEEGVVHLFRIDSSIHAGSRVYLEGNYYQKHCGGTACLASPTAQWMLARDLAIGGGKNVRATTPPLSLTNLPLFSAMPYTEVETYLRANAGARPLDRDAVDLRTITEIAARTGRVPNLTSEKAGPGTAPDGYPVLAQNRRTLTVPANPNAVVDGVGRTAIEAWLESMARALEPARQGS
jgi:pectate lyase